VLAGPSGRRTEKLAAVFDKRLKLEKGELLLQLEVREEMIGLPDWTRRREKHGPVDYPLYHLVSLNNQGKLRFSVSGLCAFPFRSEELERSLNDQDLTIKEKLKSAGDLLPGQIRDDDRGSAAYRKSLFEKDLEQLFSEMEER
jgi:CO/xanthine dehydrogenase FAD-binding subunit